MTAAGTLKDENGAAVAVAGGQVTDTTHPKIAATPFFTNSTGRFAITNLRLGARYHVQLFTGRSFDFTVPAKIEGYLDLHVVKLAAPK